MVIYTKTGDSGQTSTFDGNRLLKFDPQIEAYGSVDELQSFIALAVSKLKNKNEREFFIDIEKNLYRIMASLAGAKNQKINDKDVSKLEKYIDNTEKSLPKLNKFIIPPTTELSCLFNIARTICRRSERAIIRYYFNNNSVSRYAFRVLRYINRLSDLLFVASRYYNTKNEITLS